MITQELADAISRSLARLELTVSPDAIRLERPARLEHGDWSTNVALASAKAARRPPRELAQALVQELTKDPPRHMRRVEVAGPGFVNFHLEPGWLHEVLTEVVTGGEANYARLGDGAGRRVLVEFVSANPNGPLHAGHGRGAAYGDALARLLDRAGYEVGRETYINDRGVQMQRYADSLVAARSGLPTPEDGYAGAYIDEWAAEMPEGADPRSWGEKRALADQSEVLHLLHVNFDTWFSEMSLVDSGAIDQTLSDLADRNMTYTSEGAVWLRSTNFGDDKDRVLVKSDGDLTYMAPDIAYHRDKFGRGWDLLINVWGADHHGYIARMKAAIGALGYDPESLEVQITQMARLVKADGDGNLTEVKLSKRAGDIVELRDLINECGADATKLVYLLQSPDSPQTINLDLLAAQTMDNPVFYVQMAHARLCSIDRVAVERGLVRRPLDDVDLAPLDDPRELAVLRALQILPETISVAATERAPHRVTTWVRELAGDVHAFYHHCPILRDDVEEPVRQARWWLAAAALVGLRVGLDCLGVEAPTAMERLGAPADPETEQP